MYGQLLHATRGVAPSMDGGAYSMDGDPIHESLHIPVDPVTRLVEEDPRTSGVGQKQGKWGQGTIERDEINT